MPEIIVVSDAESTDVDHDGKSRRKQEERSSRREREAPGKEIKSPKRKVIRVESEETQDYVKRVKEYGAGRNGREDFRTERDERSARAVVSL